MIENSTLTNRYSYNYICSNNLKEINKANSSPDTYNFDVENRLVGFNTFRTHNNDYELFYDDNLITVEQKENEEATLVLETNAFGLITKVTRKDSSHTVFEYDTNNNIVKIKDFNTDGTFFYGYEITYDTKPNPYYGQLSSIYLERFIRYFRLNSNGILTALYTEEGYKFPYFKNNPVFVKYINDLDEEVLSIDYEYDSEGYPIKITETFGQNPNSKTYYIEYKS